MIGWCAWLVLAPLVVLADGLLLAGLPLRVDLAAEVAVRPLSPAGGVLLATGVPTPFRAQVADCRACGRSHTIAAHPGRAEGGAE